MLDGECGGGRLVDRAAAALGVRRVEPAVAQRGPYRGLPLRPVAASPVAGPPTGLAEPGADRLGRAEQPGGGRVLAGQRAPYGERAQRLAGAGVEAVARPASAAPRPGGRARPPGRPGTARPCPAACRRYGDPARPVAPPPPAGPRPAARPPRPGHRARQSSSARQYTAKQRVGDHAVRRAPNSMTSRQTRSASASPPRVEQRTAARPDSTRASSPASPVRRAAASARSAKQPQLLGELAVGDRRAARACGTPPPAPPPGSPRRSRRSARTAGTARAAPPGPGPARATTGPARRRCAVPAGHCPGWPTSAARRAARRRAGRARTATG